MKLYRYNQTEIEAILDEIDVIILNYGLHYHAEIEVYSEDMSALFEQLQARTAVHLDYNFTLNFNKLERGLTSVGRRVSRPAECRTARALRSFEKRTPNISLERVRTWGAHPPILKAVDGSNALIIVDCSNALERLRRYHQAHNLTQTCSCEQLSAETRTTNSVRGLFESLQACPL